MSLGDREIAAFNVEVSQEIADELHATLAESNALVFGQIGQPGSVLTLGRKWSGAPRRASSAMLPSVAVTTSCSGSVALLITAAGRSRPSTSTSVAVIASSLPCAMRTTSVSADAAS